MSVLTICIPEHVSISVLSVHSVVNLLLDLREADKRGRQIIKAIIQVQSAMVQQLTRIAA